jgi:heptose I phosphotransferase
MLIFPPEWEKLWSGKDPFDQIFALEGQEYRNMDGRRTLRFELLGKSFFVKMYSGLGWKRIFKYLLTFRFLPVSRAYNEWRAVGELKNIGVETMTVVAYGERGSSPATRQSFLVTEDLAQTESLEDFCRDWSVSPPSPRLKRALIERVATMSRLLHNNGINHRDFYLCHFLLDVATGRDQVDPDNLHLYLIDLHRVQIHRQISFRRQLKDLAALYFSSLEAGLTTRDYWRFLRCYENSDLNTALRGNKKLIKKIIQRGGRLQQRFDRKFRRLS